MAQWTAPALAGARDRCRRSFRSACAPHCCRRVRPAGNERLRADRDRDGVARPVPRPAHLQYQQPQIPSHLPDDQVLARRGCRGFSAGSGWLDVAGPDRRDLLHARSEIFNSDAAAVNLTPQLRPRHGGRRRSRRLGTGRIPSRSCSPNRSSAARSNAATLLLARLGAHGQGRHAAGVRLGAAASRQAMLFTRSVAPRRRARLVPLLSAPAPGAAGHVALERELASLRQTVEKQQPPSTSSTRR